MLDIFDFDRNGEGMIEQNDIACSRVQSYSQAEGSNECILAQVNKTVRGLENAHANAELFQNEYNHTFVLVEECD